MFYKKDDIGMRLRDAMQNFLNIPSQMYGGFFNATNTIVVYGGTMPSGADFTTNWGTKYEPVSGSDILVKYTAAFAGNNNLVYIPNIPSTGTYVADGTATWASILPAYHPDHTQIWGTSVNPPAWIVDVTEPSGTGVVQLDSTIVSGSAPAFNSCSFTLTGE